MLLVRHIENVFTILDWYKLRERIDFAPTYQRKGGIWGIKMRQLFVNTILNQYDFPKIYLADFTLESNRLNEGKKQFAVIDGKQRLSTVFGFFDSEFVLDNTPINYEGEIFFAGGFNFEVLQSQYPFLAKRFEDYVPTVMGVEADRTEDIYEMFIRLNINVSISGPERRNALPGPVPSIIRRIALHPFFAERIKFPVERGQDLNAAAKLLLLEVSGGPTSTKKSDLDSLVERAQGYTEEDIFPYADKVISGLDMMYIVFRPKDELLQTQTQLPVYYLFVKKHYTGKNAMDIIAFLDSFERERRQVKKVLRSRATGQTETFEQEIDVKALDFNSFIRSPDDKISIERMLAILSDVFNNRWQKKENS